MAVSYRIAMWILLLIGMGIKSAVGTASMAAINILVSKNSQKIPQKLIHLFIIFPNL